MSVIIRKATIDDAKQKGTVHYLSWQETYADLLPKEYLALQTLDKCIKIAHDYPANTFVAFVRGKMVGFSCYLDQQIKESSIKPSSILMALYVLKEYQGKGIGKQLLEKALAELKKENIVVFVLKGNDAAISFYQHMGFSFTGHYLQHQVVGGEYIELEMVKKVHKY